MDFPKFLPIHILQWLPSLPPLAGLIDLARTVRWRKKNPFMHLMWHAVWGRRPVLYLALMVLAISIATIGPTELVYWVFGWLPTSLAPTRYSLVNALYYGMLPQFLGDPGLYLAGLLAWRIRQFRQNPAFESDIVAVPNWRPLVFRAVGIQVCATAFFLALLAPVGGMAGLLVDYSGRVFMLPPGTPHLDLLQYAFKSIGYSGVYLISMAWLWDWGVYWLGVALSLIVFLRAKTVPLLIVGVLAMNYSLQYFCTILHWAINDAYSFYERLVSLVAYLLIAGWLWQLAYHRFCRTAPVSQAEP